MTDRDDEDWRYALGWIERVPDDRRAEQIIRDGRDGDETGPLSRRAIALLSGVVNVMFHPDGLWSGTLQVELRAQIDALLAEHAPDHHVWTSAEFDEHCRAALDRLRSDE